MEGSDGEGRGPKRRCIQPSRYGDDNSDTTPPNDILLPPLGFLGDGSNVFTDTPHLPGPEFLFPEHFQPSEANFLQSQPTWAESGPQLATYETWCEAVSVQGNQVQEYAPENGFSTEYFMDQGSLDCSIVPFQHSIDQSSSHSEAGYESSSNIREPSRDTSTGFASESADSSDLNEKAFAGEVIEVLYLKCSTGRRTR